MAKKYIFSGQGARAPRRSRFTQGTNFRFSFAAPATSYPEHWNELHQAYSTRDTNLSKKVHDDVVKNAGAAEELHGGDVSEYLQSIIFGGLDGIITTFAVIMAAAAGHLTYGIILIITFSNLMGDAIGMGIGDFVSSKAEEDAAESERNREAWELANKPDDEKKEMVDIYVSKGYSARDAQEVVDLLFESKDAFLEVMLMEELGILSAEAGPSAIKSGLITFSSFVILGGIPALPYLFSGEYNRAAQFDGVFGAAIALFVIVLFTLGAFRGRITGKRWYLTGLTMLLNGAFTTGIAFILGYFLQPS